LKSSSLIIINVCFFSCSRSPRPLHLVNLKSTSTSSTFSPSSDFHSKSPQSLASHLSQSTITLAPSPMGYTHQKTKSEEAGEDAGTNYSRDTAPAYYEIGAPIDASRGNSVHEEHMPSLPEIDNSDTFTLSTFSYYGQPPSPIHLSPSTLPPHSPSVMLQSLPPPPRRMPRHVSSSASVTSMSSFRSENPTVYTPSIPGVPEDVGPTSYGPSRTLGVPGGRIMVTIQRQASVDATV